uniref:arrestin domain-containing protein 3-like n=1 Tax=Scatophagus argus TaxID=75038 RepID=UPI001ED8003D|nr:arrestin domain-containing protein 3-like [Scatophagus argus]
MFQQTFKNFNINFNRLNAENSYSSGDLITGHISFDLTKETKITSITMAVKGKADVHWSSGSGGKNGQRRNYHAEVKYFDLKAVIVAENVATGRTTQLQPGTHMYPFTCQLPHGDFPASFKGAHGKIVYTLTVGINRPWHMSKDFVTELNFVSRMNTNLPELWYPLSGTNTMTLCCLWCASGPITLTAAAEKKAFSPGETVKIICNIQNSSSRTLTPKLKLQVKQTFYTHNKASKKIFVKNLNSVTGEPISPDALDVHAEFMLTIPSSASLSISNCSILLVDYIIEVNLKVSSAPDLTVLIPIILFSNPIQPIRE